MKFMRIPFILSTAVLALSLAPVAHAGAQGRWKEAGKTSAGSTVYVDPATVKKVNGITTARVRVKFVSPVGPPNASWIASHHVLMFDCAKSTVAAKESVYYSDAAATKVVNKSAPAKPGFGPALGGSMTKVALDYVCKK